MIGRERGSGVGGEMQRKSMHERRLLQQRDLLGAWQRRVRGAQMHMQARLRRLSVRDWYVYEWKIIYLPPTKEEVNVFTRVCASACLSVCLSVCMYVC